MTVLGYKTLALYGSKFRGSETEKRLNTVGMASNRKTIIEMRREIKSLNSVGHNGGEKEEEENMTILNRIRLSLVLSFCIWSFRFLAYAVIIEYRLPVWCFLGVEVLHGPSFALMFSSLLIEVERFGHLYQEVEVKTDCKSKEVVNRFSKEGSSVATLQGLLSGIMFGIASSLGTLIGGFVVQWTSVLWLFYFTSCFCFACALTFSLFHWLICRLSAGTLTSTTYHEDDVNRHQMVPLTTCDILRPTTTTDLQD
ncbi:unnamed protein product [Protopolystoma xenopodis]|uniref:Uncharacterized protein n=1 Tax=Protopolystoma xenopodis TaxID=117903 RepID=A0A448XAP6_9PLAT|nr:unnamed protein product [Protopolystoma xenopodis]